MALDMSAYYDPMHAYGAPLYPPVGSRGTTWLNVAGGVPEASVGIEAETSSNSFAHKTSLAAARAVRQVLNAFYL